MTNHEQTHHLERLRLTLRCHLDMHGPVIDGLDGWEISGDGGNLVLLSPGTSIEELRRTDDEADERIWDLLSDSITDEITQARSGEDR